MMTFNYRFVNGKRYHEMISNSFLAKMQELDLHDMWLQQDGATCHTACVKIDLLTISRSEPVNWPPRSYDQTPLDYFLWGYFKAHVYTNKSASIDALEDKIEAFIREISAEMLERVCQNWTKRMRRSRDQHLHEIIFKH